MFNKIGKLVNAKTILVVDDDAMNREVMEAFLIAESYQVLLAHNGTEGLELARRHLPDLILLDVRMPDISGYDVCAELKAQPPTQRIPIMLVTGFDAPEDRKLGVAAGADDFLSRPFNGEQLLQRVARLLL